MPESLSFLAFFSFLFLRGENSELRFLLLPPVELSDDVTELSKFLLVGVVKNTVM